MLDGSATEDVVGDETWVEETTCDELWVEDTACDEEAWPETDEELLPLPDLPKVASAGPGNWYTNPGL